MLTGGALSTICEELDPCDRFVLEYAFKLFPIKAPSSPIGFCNSIERLEWIYPLCATKNVPYKIVAASGNVELMKVIAPIPRTIVEECCKIAVIRGNIPMCEWIHKTGVPKGLFAIMSIMADQPDVFTWAADSMRFIDVPNVIALAVKHEREKIISWLIERGIMTPMFMVNIQSSDEE